MSITSLPPHSPFSAAVFQLLRSRIPRGDWPENGDMQIPFHSARDGLWLEARFGEYLPKKAANLAEELIRGAGVDLVLLSPMAARSVATFKIRRWRDAALFALLPLMFAIPLMAALAQEAMTVAAVLFILDAAALLSAQLRLSAARKALGQDGFIAHIPVPGLTVIVHNPLETLSMDSNL